MGECTTLSDWVSGGCSNEEEENVLIVQEGCKDCNK
jgi:hypothetical protein